MSDLKPGKPTVSEQTSTTIKLLWDQPATALKINHFEIKYRREDEIWWKGIETEDARNEIRITDLKSNSTYFFKIRSLYGAGEESGFGETSSGIRTMDSLAEKIKAKSTELQSDECQYLYKIPIVKEERNDQARVRKCTVLTKNKNPTKFEKTVMVVGATGAGKSTLIDGMVNYIVDVAWEEDVRFKVIDLTEEEKAKHRDQRVSQTEWITIYSIHWMPGCLVDFHLRLIDTPGFGDTRGIDRDKRLVEQIRALFTDPGIGGIDRLDAVWFVTQAPMFRLSPTQRYIFDSILSVFGKDIKSNIFVLITFADGKKPPVLDALAEADVPYLSDFWFNNSALYVDPVANPTSQLFWKMGKTGFENFFEVLGQTESRSLILTKEVLRTRKRLEEKISIIQNQITFGMQKMISMREEKEELKKNERLIADSKDFEYSATEYVMKKTALSVGRHTTTCRKCNRTCHDNCAYADDKDKMMCITMTNNYCTVCPQKCIWSDHSNFPYLLHYESVTKKKTYEETKQKYLSAEKDKTKNVSVIDSLTSEYNELMAENEKLVAEVKECINKLQDIALVPNPISEIEYIQILIENETDAKKRGYKERVKILEELKRKAESIQEIKEDRFKFPANGQVLT